MDYHQCGDCREIYDDDSLPKTLWQVNHLADRLDPGSEVPSGECKCGALTYVCKDAPLKLLAAEGETDA